MHRDLNWWGLLLVVSGGGLNALAAELSKLLPDEVSKQLVIGFGVIAILAGLILQLKPEAKPSGSA